MHPLEEFAGFDLATSRYEKKSRRLRPKYLWVGHLSQSTRAHR
ncbi:hypothetical protein Gohar_003809 [Gossypium harknessii]|uniref:Uncharacterized protein n=1 Tax=Gossypium harknessii TaxID=34285 RepID=A0A7J9I6B8_9ROSI|nr:hypothetical protein [Gossypium harknessii]